MVVAFAVERDGEDGERAARGAPRSIVGAAFGCGGGPGLSSRRTVATRGAAACAQATRRQRARAVVSGWRSSMRGASQSSSPVRAVVYRLKLHDAPESRRASSEEVNSKLFEVTL